MTSRPSRVALLTNIYAPYKERLLAELARRVNLSVYYCAVREANRQWEVRFSGAYSYRVLRGSTIPFAGTYLHVNPEIVRVLRADAPELLIVGGYSYPTAILAALAARSMAIPTLLWSGSTELETSRWRPLTRPVKKMLVRRFDGYIAYTSRAADYLVSLGAAPERVVVAPVTVDTAFFERRAAELHADPGRERVRGRLGIAPGELTIMFVGQLVARKGGDTLLRAMARVRHLPLRALMVGSGPLLEPWRRLADELGLGARVTWCGHLSQEDLAERYAAADLMVLPSRLDPSGNVINEAMAAGLPVVISDRVGTDVVRAHQDGLVFPAGDDASLAACLQLVIADPALRRTMGRSAQARIRERFSIEHEAQQFVAAIDRVLTGTPPRAVSS